MGVRSLLRHSDTILTQIRCGLGPLVRVPNLSLLIGREPSWHCSRVASRDAAHGEDARASCRAAASPQALECRINSGWLGRQRKLPRSFVLPPTLPLLRLPRDSWTSWLRGLPRPVALVFVRGPKAAHARLGGPPIPLHRQIPINSNIVRTKVVVYLNQDP